MKPEELTKETKKGSFYFQEFHYINGETKQYVVEGIHTGEVTGGLILMINDGSKENPEYRAFPFENIITHEDFIQRRVILHIPYRNFSPIHNIIEKIYKGI